MFKDQFREYRLKLGLTQDQIKDILEVPLRTIENWEGGKSEPKPWSQKLLLEKLENMYKTRIEGIDMKKLIGKPRPIGDQASINLLSSCGATYATGGYVDDLTYYQGEESVRKAKILAKDLGAEAARMLVENVIKSNVRMENISREKN